MRSSLSAILFRSLGLAGLILAIDRPATAGPMTYIALGDSLAFGETDFTHNPSNGDGRGYVGPFADHLGALQGTRPKVIDLGVDGETTSTFLNGGPQGSGPLPGAPAYQLNTNYPGTPTSQNAMLLSTIAAEQAAGRTIDTVSVQLGANDLYLAASSPGFFNLPQAQQLGRIFQSLATVAANDATLLAELKSRLPGASIVMVGYYDPYAPFANNPGSPFYKVAQASQIAIPILNQIIQAEAAAVGARYIDIATPFAGHELAYTSVANGGNFHPTQAGYDAIAGQLSTVPEPSVLATVGIGLAGLVARRHRRRRAA